MSHIGFNQVLIPACSAVCRILRSSPALMSECCELLSMSATDTERSMVAAMLSQQSKTKLKLLEGKSRAFVLLEMKYKSRA